MKLSEGPLECKRCGHWTPHGFYFCEYCGAPLYNHPPEKKYLNSVTDVSAESLINAVEDEYGVAYSRDGKRLVRCRNENLRQYIVKEGTKVICDRAFRLESKIYPKLASIEIPNSVTTIGRLAFCKCENLTTIELPKGLTSIGGWAFAWCKSLTSIELPESVTTIGAVAFGGCKSLPSIELPDGVTSIGGGAFVGCDRLEKVYIRCSDGADKNAVLEKFKKLLPERLHSKIEVVRR